MNRFHRYTEEGKTHTYTQTDTHTERLIYDHSGFYIYQASCTVLLRELNRGARRVTLDWKSVLTYCTSHLHNNINCFAGRAYKYWSTTYRHVGSQVVPVHKRHRLGPCESHLDIFCIKFSRLALVSKKTMRSIWLQWSFIPNYENWQIKKTVSNMGILCLQYHVSLLMTADIKLPCCISKAYFHCSNSFALANQRWEWA